MKIKVKVDVERGVIIVKRRFGDSIQYSGGWYTDRSINEVVADYCECVTNRFSRKISKNVRKGN